MEDKKREARRVILDDIYNGYSTKCILSDFMKYKDDLDKDDIYYMLHQWHYLTSFNGAII